MQNRNDEQAWPQTEVSGTIAETNADYSQFGDRGPGNNGAIDEDALEVTTDCQDWPGRDRARRLAGGILSQLIEDYEDQLAESVRRTAKLQSKLERLKQLQLLQSK